MKSKDIRKEYSRKSHRAPSKDIDDTTSVIEYDDQVYRVTFDKYAATVTFDSGEVAGIYKAASRHWKGARLPKGVQIEVEKLYS